MTHWTRSSTRRDMFVCGFVLVDFRPFQPRSVFGTRHRGIQGELNIESVERASRTGPEAKKTPEISCRHRGVGRCSGWFQAKWRILTFPFPQRPRR